MGARLDVPLRGTDTSQPARRARRARTPSRAATGRRRAATARRRWAAARTRRGTDRSRSAETRARRRPGPSRSGRARGRAGPGRSRSAPSRAPTPWPASRPRRAGPPRAARPSSSPRMPPATRRLRLRPGQHRRAGGAGRRARRTGRRAGEQRRSPAARDARRLPGNRDRPGTDRRGAAGGQDLRGLDELRHLPGRDGLRGERRRAGLRQPVRLRWRRLLDQRTANVAAAAADARLVGEPLAPPPIPPSLLGPARRTLERPPSMAFLALRGRMTETNGPRGRHACPSDRARPRSNSRSWPPFSWRCFSASSPSARSWLRARPAEHRERGRQSGDRRPRFRPSALRSPPRAARRGLAANPLLTGGTITIAAGPDMSDPDLFPSRCCSDLNATLLNLIRSRSRCRARLVRTASLRRGGL